MFFIVLSHTGVPNIYTRFYTPIFLTAFFFVSGYTFSTKANFRIFLTSKIKALIVPMLCFGTFDAVVAHVVRGDNIIKRYIGLLLQRSCHGDDFWFLGCLFTILMMFYIIVRVTRDNPKLIIIMSIVIAVLGYLYIGYINIKLPWQFEGAMVMEIWLALGYLYKKYEYKLEKFIDKKYLIILGVIYVFTVLIYDNDVNIRLENYKCIAMFVISSIVGIAMLVVGSKILKHNKILCFIGFNSLIFYALQSKCIKISSYILTNVLNAVDISLTKYLACVLDVVMACILIVPCVYFINRYVPFVVGKWNSKKVS